MDRPDPFPCGSLPEEVVSRLRLFVRLWRISIYELWWHGWRGFFLCPHCPPPGDDQLSLRRGGGWGGFGVPAGPTLYVAAGMTIHFVEAHNYLPPEPFVRALMQSPLPGTREYRAAVAGFHRYIIDHRGSEYARYDEWKRQYPSFPGVATCCRLAHVEGRPWSWDLLAWELYENAQEHGEELIAAFPTETRQFQWRIMRVLAHARVKAALPLFLEHVQSPDLSLRLSAQRGLCFLEPPGFKVLADTLDIHPSEDPWNL
jgi:hypothetical protein